MHQVYLRLEAYPSMPEGYRYDLFLEFCHVNVPFEDHPATLWEKWFLYTNLLLWGEDRHHPTLMYRHLKAQGLRIQCTKST